MSHVCQASFDRQNIATLFAFLVLAQLIQKLDMCFCLCVCVAVLRLRNKFSKELLCRACAADNFKPVTGEEVHEKGVSHSTM